MPPGRIAPRAAKASAPDRPEADLPAFCNGSTVTCDPAACRMSGRWQGAKVRFWRIVLKNSSFGLLLKRTLSV